MTRIIVFSGKGGVGKTSVAAAHARISSKQGKKTLLVSTDMAHNISDIFETKLGKVAQEVTPNLFVLEVDPNHIMENDFQDMHQALINMLGSTGIPNSTIDNVYMFPGIDELFALLKIMEIYEQGEYERIIVDCAPTGETLSLLKFPELLSWYMEKLFPIGKVAMRVLSPISKTLFKVQLPDKKAMSDIEKIYIKLVQLQELLKNRESTSIRLVTMPEKMVVEETKRSYMYMNLYGFLVDGIYINRILPKAIENHFFKQWVQIQNQYIKELEDVFIDIPIYRIPWFDSDLHGVSGIDTLERALEDATDIFEIKQNNHQECYEKTDDGYVLKLYLPCAQKGDLDLHVSNTDIIIKIGNFKRNLLKPNSLRHYEISSAKMNEDVLNIYFKEIPEEKIQL